MDGNRLVRGYLALGLRLDRLVPGLVDAYTGDQGLRRAVADEPTPVPADLAAQAAGLRAELPSSDLAPERVAFLDAQLTAAEQSARSLDGARTSFVEEVRAYFQVRVHPGSTDAYRAAHAALDELLPGDGPLRLRLAEHRDADTVPRHRLADAVTALSDALRARVAPDFALPPDEGVEHEVVTDRPWSGFTHHLGGNRSRVSVNADMGHRYGTLPHLIAHEAYPGHHTEHCRRTAALVDGLGHVEHSLFLVNSPRCLVSEGAAELGLHLAVGPGWGRWAEEVLGDVGLRFDGGHVERVESALSGLLTVRQDAALMLHDQRADPDDVVDFLRRWLLVPHERAGQLVRFLSDPLWRAYTTTYVEGVRLVGTWLDLRPPGGPLVERFRRLLDEPLVPRSLEAELAAGVPWLPRNSA